VVSIRLAGRRSYSDLTGISCSPLRIHTGASPLLVHGVRLSCDSVSAGTAGRRVFLRHRGAHAFTQCGRSSFSERVGYGRSLQPTLHAYAKHRCEHHMVSRRCERNTRPQRGHPFTCRRGRRCFLVGGRSIKFVRRPGVGLLKKVTFLPQKAVFDFIGDTSWVRTPIITYCTAA
jgi:hypothetical protein